MLTFERLDNAPVVIEKTTIVVNKFTGEEYDASQLTKYTYQELLARPLPKDVILSRKEVK